MLDSDSTLKYFSSLPLQTHQIKLSNTSKEIIYLSNLSQINTQEEDPSNLPLRIHYITEAKFYELVTSYEYQDTEIFNTLLYGYYFFTDEQKLFRNLIERFRLVNPLNLSKNEGLFFQRKLLKTIQIKVLIFFQQWFKSQKPTLLFADCDIESCFVEALYCLVNSQFAGKWIEEPIFRFFDEIDEISYNRTRESLRKKKLLSSYLIDFVLKSYSLIKNRKNELSQCITLYDQSNFERIPIREMLKRNPRTDQNKNYYHFIDSFNFLSRFACFLLLNVNDNFNRRTFFEDLIDLIEELVKLNNFHSSYAIFLGISCPAITRLSTILEQKLSKNYKNKLEKLTEIFDKSYKVKDLQSKALLPCIPALSFLTKELTQIEEFFKLQDKEVQLNLFTRKNMVNFLKIMRLAGVIKRIEMFRSCKYVFSKKYNEEFIRDFVHLPNIDEDSLYDMSNNIL